MTLMAMEDLADKEARHGHRELVEKLEAENARLREALIKYRDALCEGWCREVENFTDPKGECCSGCLARTTLEGEADG